MNKEELRALTCRVSNYVSGIEDIDFIDSWRLIQYRENYLEVAPRLLELLKDIESLEKLVNDRP